MFVSTSRRQTGRVQVKSVGYKTAKQVSRDGAKSRVHTSQQYKKVKGVSPPSFQIAEGSAGRTGWNNRGVLCLHCAEAHVIVSHGSGTRKGEEEKAGTTVSSL